MISTSVVIVSYNTKNLLENCLRSLKKATEQNDNVVVWVVDNDSGDGSTQMVRKKFPWVNLIVNKENLGFATANNQAIRKLRGEYIFLLNPDTVVQERSIREMILYMEKNPDVGILGPKLLNYDGSIQREMSPFPRILDSILILLRLHRIKPFRNIVYPNYNYNIAREAEHLMGSALLISKKVFESVGVFDEDFFLWFEETDLQKRTIDAGWKIVYYPKAVIKHFGAQSSKQLNPFRKQTIWNRSLWVYFKKHHSIFKSLVLIPFMALSYIPALLVYFGKRFLVR